MTYKDVKALFERPDVDDAAVSAHLGHAPEDLSFVLNRAAYAGRLDLLECALRHEPSPGSRDQALVNAAGRAGGADVVRVLLGAGADPDGGGDGFPLWAAARAGAADTVRLLLEAGADADVVVREPFEPDTCKHPLTAAVRAGAVAAVAALLDGGADPDVLTPTLRRPLEIALETGNPAVVALLRERGATVLDPGECDLGQAAHRGFAERVRVLLPRASIAERGSALVTAVQERQASAAAVVLEHGGLDPAVIGPAFGQCVAFDVPEVAPLLIAAGLVLDAPDNYYRTPPVVLAAERGRTGIVRLLLAAGADPQARNEEGQNALAVARHEGHAEVVRLLEAAGATARTPAQLRRAAREKLAARSTWTPQFGGDGTANGDPSQFGGTPWLRDGEAWPACAGCGGPLTLFVQVDLGRTPPAARAESGPGLLQLFHCLACDRWHPARDDHPVRIIDVAGAAPATDVPHGVRVFPRRPVVGWSRRLADYPWGEGTEHLAPDERAAAFALNRQGDKLGGWPNWVQDPDYPHCTTGEHRLLLQLDSNRGVPHTWGDNGVAVILQCSVHRDELAFTWQSG